MLSQGQYRILIEKEDILKIRIGATIVQLIPKQKSQIIQLKQTIQQLLKRQSQLQNIIESQQLKINNYEIIIQQLNKELQQKRQAEKKDNLNQLKDNYKKQDNLKEIHIKLTQQLKSYQWNKQFKSDDIIIQGKTLTKIGKSKHFQFCLLSLSLTQKIKQKQHWSIKIKKQSGGIGLGICSKSLIQKHKFSGEKINWKETKHGLYLICSGGWCWSHSQKIVNNVKQTFKFRSGDFILIEYDPIERVLRFIKNENEEEFVMSIQISPQNDAYYPCVCFDYCISTSLKKPPLIELIDL